jgi:putative membrane protein
MAHLTLLDRRSALILAGGAAGLLVAAARPAMAQTPLRSRMMTDNYVTSVLQMGQVSIAMSELMLNRPAEDPVRQFADLEIAEQQTIAGILQASVATDSVNEDVGNAQPSPTSEQSIERITRLGDSEEAASAYLEAQLLLHKRLMEVQRVIAGDREPSIESVVGQLSSRAVEGHISMLAYLLLGRGLDPARVLDGGTSQVDDSPL